MAGEPTEPGPPIGDGSLNPKTVDPSLIQQFSRRVVGKVTGREAHREAGDLGGSA